MSWLNSARVRFASSSAGVSGRLSSPLPVQFLPLSLFGPAAISPSSEQRRVEEFLRRQWISINHQHADHAWQTAEFYRRTSHLEAAHFYYKLVKERYPNTSYSEKAIERMDEMRMKLEKRSGPPTRIGQIILIGNEKVSDRLIRTKIGLYPGQLLNDADNHAELRAAEKRLAESGLFNLDPQRGIRPTIRALESDNGYKDILVTVQEK